MARLPFLAAEGAASNGSEGQCAEDEGPAAVAGNVGSCPGAAAATQGRWSGAALRLRGSFRFFFSFAFFQTKKKKEKVEAAIGAADGSPSPARASLSLSGGGLEGCCFTSHPTRGLRPLWRKGAKGG